MEIALVYTNTMQTIVLHLYKLPNTLSFYPKAKNCPQPISIEHEQLLYFVSRSESGNILHKNTQELSIRVEDFSRMSFSCVANLET